MQRSILQLDKQQGQTYQAIFKNNHGRMIYIRLKCEYDKVTVIDCFYTDRPERNGVKIVPLKFKTTQCNRDDLLNVLADELDKQFFVIEFSENELNISAEVYISLKNQHKRKYKFLILVNGENTYKTRLKNRIHRSVYLEISHNDHNGVIMDCHYYDRSYKRNSAYITPSGLTSITFDFSLENILKIVNDELNCDFTDVIITKDSFGFDNSSLPICGSI